MTTDHWRQIIDKVIVSHAQGHSVLSHYSVGIVAMAHRMSRISSTEEWQYYERDIQIGADGSVIKDGDFVYLSRSHSVQQVNYF